MSKNILLIVILALVSKVISALPTEIGELKVKEAPGKIIIPAMARKAGGRLRPELLKGNSPDATKVEEISGNVEHTDEVYDYGVWSSSSEEEDCPKRMYYHIRGKQCVPIRCRGGNRWRNKMTGDCMNDYAKFHGSTGLGQGLISSNSHSRLSPSVWRRTRYYKQRSRLMRG